MSAHWYDKEGNLVPAWTKGAYPSPSTILDRIKSDSYEAMVRRIGLEAADELMNKAAERGTYIHAQCEALVKKQAVLIDGKFVGGNDETRPYVQGFVDWSGKYGAKTLHSEIFLRSPKYKYAGRADLVVELDGQIWIVDIKTGQDSVRHGLQLKFYAQAYAEMTGVRPRMGVLALDAKRACGYRNSKQPYGLQEYNEPLSAIKAHIDVFRWWNKKQPAVEPVDASLIWKGKVSV